MINRILLPFICSVFFTSTIFSQNFEKQKYIDSLTQAVKAMPEDTLKIAVYTKLYEKLMFRDPELSFEYAKKEYQLSKKLNYPKGIAVSQLHFGDYYKDRGQVDSARHYFNKSMEGFKEINFTKGLLFANHSIAAFEQSLGNYDKALEYAYENIALYDKSKTMERSDGGSFNLIGSEYELIGGIHQELGNYKIALTETLKALKFFEQKKDTIRTGDALMQLGSIESSLGNYTNALNYSKQAYAIYEDFKDLQYQAYSANYIGDNYIALNQFENAKSHFEKALELARQIKNLEIEGSALVSLGSVYSGLNEFKEARRVLNEGLAIHRKLDYKKTISIDLNELAKVEIKDNRPQKAIAYLNESISLAKEINAKNNLSTAYLLRSEAYEKLGNSSIALADHKQFKAINDSIFNLNKSQQIEELRSIFETEKKEQEIAFQQNEIELLQEKQKASTLQKTLLILGIIGLLAAFSFTYYALKQRMKRNKLIRENLDKDLEFKNKELTTHAMHLAQKNKVLEELKNKVKELKSQSANRGFQDIINTINFNIQDDNNWEDFARYFEEVHTGFNASIKQRYPDITTNELRLMSLLKMNMSGKEIASILNISNEGVKKARYRLRKKLELTSDDSLQDVVLQL